MRIRGVVFSADLWRLTLIGFVIGGMLGLVQALCHGQNFRTIQQTETARKLVARAEECRKGIALAWFGIEMNNWTEPCHISWQQTRGASGVTTYAPGPQPTNMRMIVRGSWADIMNDVIPHEVCHLVAADYVGGTFPRWMDEGMCSTCESDESITALEDALEQDIRNGRGYPTNVILMSRGYPAGINSFYRQSCSLARFLIGKHGKEKWLRFAVERSRMSDNWTGSLRRHYGYPSIHALQDDWLGWVKQGSPDIVRMMKPIPRSQAPYRPWGQQSTAGQSSQPYQPLPSTGQQQCADCNQPPGGGGKPCNCVPRKVSIGKVETVDPGQPATVKDGDPGPDLLMEFEIPRGADGTGGGQDGKDGRGIKMVKLEPGNEVVIVYTDGTQETVGKIAVAGPDEETVKNIIIAYLDANADKFKGEKGEPGEPGQPGELTAGPVPIYLLGQDQSGRWQKLDSTKSNLTQKDGTLVAEPVAIDIFDLNERLEALQGR